MRCSRWAAIAVAIVLASAAAASADPITIVHDGRVASVGPFLSDPSSPPTPRSVAKASDTLVTSVTTPAGTNPTTGTATLTSTFVDPLHWSGTGTANVSWISPADISAGSNFIADFLVASPVTYAFNADAAAASSGCCSETQASAGLSVFSGFVDRDGEEIFNDVFHFATRRVVSTDSDAANRSFTGLLSPGKYLLKVDATSVAVALVPSRTRQGSTAANFAFIFDFTPADSSPSPTPEPTSLLLLRTAIAGAFGFRSRSSNRAR